MKRSHPDTADREVQRIVANSCEETVDLQARCIICSSEFQTVRHQHFSSLWLRDILGVDINEGRYQCPSCKSRHKAFPYKRAKLVLGDSTIHQFFSPPGQLTNLYEGDLVHSDYITIPNAKIDTLTDAFEKECGNGQILIPMDVVMVAGYSDLVAGSSTLEIMNSFRRFTRAVLSRNIEGEKENTVAICNLYYPPMLAWLYDNGQMPDSHPGNQLSKLELLNEAILSLNLDNNITEFPRLHKFGVRNYVRKSTNDYGQQHHVRIKSHRFEHWVGTDPSRMISLISQQRTKIGSAINKYFMHRTDVEW